MSRAIDTALRLNGISSNLFRHNNVSVTPLRITQTSTVPSRSMSQMRKMMKPKKPFFQSTGQIFDPYTPADKMPKTYKPFYDPRGLLQRFIWWILAPPLRKFTTSFAFQRAQRDAHSLDRTETVSKRLLLQDCLNTFWKYNDALAKGDVTALRRICTEPHAETLEKKHSAKWAKTSRYETKRNYGYTTPKIVNARFVQIPGMSHSFLQATVKIQSSQSIQMYDKGDLVAGDDVLKPQTDYMVFEKDMSRARTPWLVAGVIQPNV